MSIDLKDIKYSIITDTANFQKALFVRGIVFCEEQNVEYSNEIDGMDISAIHFLVTYKSEPIATARLRLFPEYAKIERLAVRKNYRKMNIGKNLFQYVINYISELNFNKIVIHAQKYLLDFYENFGFNKKGDIFLDANIEHYYMEKILNN